MRSEPSGYFSEVVSHPLIHIQYMHEVNGVAQLGSSPPVHAGIWHTHDGASGSASNSP
jgi:hypothetical protein